LGVGRRENNCSGISGGDFQSKTRARENGDARRRVEAHFFRDHFADARVRVRFEALGRADENGIWIGERAHRAIKLSCMSRRHHAQYDAGTGKRFF
jgi:hypothetical protein